MDAVLAAIAKMYPDGARYFNPASGKRVEEPFLSPTKRGYRVNINGEYHIFDREGRFVSSGAANYSHRKIA